jgi:hypothetical protein
MSILDLADVVIILLPVALGALALSMFTLHLRHAH